MKLAGLFPDSKTPREASPESSPEPTQAKLADLWFAVKVPPERQAFQSRTILFSGRIPVLASICLLLLIYGVVNITTDPEAFVASLAYTVLFWGWLVTQHIRPAQLKLDAWIEKYHRRPLDATMDQWYASHIERLTREAVQRAGFTLAELISSPVVLLNDSRRYESEGIEPSIFRRGFDEVERTNWYRAYVLMMGPDRFVIHGSNVNPYAGRGTEGESFGGLYRDILSLAQTGGGWNVILRSGLSVFVSYSDHNRGPALEAYVRLSNLKDMAEQRAGEEMGRIWRN